MTIAKRNQRASIISSGSHNVSSQSNNHLSVEVHIDICQACVKKCRDQDQSNTNDEVSLVAKHQSHVSAFERALATIPSDIGYSLDRYLHHSQEDALPAGVLSRHIEWAGDMPGRYEQQPGSELN